MKKKRSKPNHRPKPKAKMKRTHTPRPITVPVVPDDNLEFHDEGEIREDEELTGGNHR
jgi:hypothetical protein